MDCPLLVDMYIRVVYYVNPIKAITQYLFCIIRRRYFVVNVIVENGLVSHDDQPQIRAPKTPY